MKKFFYGATFCLLIISCNETNNKMNTSSSPTNENTGYKTIFDGKTMDGWRSYQNKPQDSWSVVDGILYCRGSLTDKSDKRADLITTKQYEIGKSVV